MNRVAIGGLMVLLLAVSPALAATISVGTHELLPGTAVGADSQVIGIWVEAEDGDPPIAGAVIEIQVGDGGPAAGGTTAGPRIVAVDVVSSGGVSDLPGNPERVFSQHPNTGNVGPGAIVPQVASVGTTLGESSPGVPAPGFVANGLLCTITLDTTGFTVDDGPWDLILSQTLNGATVLNEDTPEALPIPLTVADGSIVIVPEPATIVMLLGLLAAVPFAWRKRK
ncbi:MAG: PEP-CTERM sorting domain-containing protein [Pirellulales bacterium]|nr:PEP-CTERM sorting domain-containing protein [Pirellulales bacterium]